MPSADAITDEQVATVLGGYAGLVHRVLAEPGRWLGLDDEPPPTAKLPAKVVDAVRDRAFGDVTPANPAWDSQPEDKRIEWWIRRIGVSAGLAAAAPRLAGALSDRIPLQAALGTSAAGLAVCATARELGVTDARAWVPLLAKVLLDRDLPEATEVPVKSADQAAQELDEAATEAPGADAESGKQGGGLARGARRAASTLWRLSRQVWELQSILDERPRGNVVFRAVAMVPVVGLVGGWLDERGGIRRASRETIALVRPGTRKRWFRRG